MKRYSLQWAFSIPALLVALTVLASSLFVAWQMERSYLYSQLSDRSLLSARLLARSINPNSNLPFSPSQAIDPAVSKQIGALAPSGVMILIQRQGSLYASDQKAQALATFISYKSEHTYKVSVGGVTYRMGIAEWAGSRVQLALSEKDASTRSRTLIKTLLFIALGVLFPLFILMWWLGRMITRPLKDMSDSIEHISNQKSEIKLDEASRYTELYRLAHSFNHMMERLKKSSDTQERLVHDISHELRTPLAIARGHLELSQNTQDISEWNEASEIAIGEIDRMNQLVETLLAQARIDPEHWKVIDLKELAQDATQRLELMGGSIKVQGASAWVKADPAALERVLVNLYTNAIRYAPENTYIEVNIENVNSQVILKVRDYGPGIDQEVLEHLFDRFTRSDQARTRKTGGFGLGLAISKAIVEQHQGTIKAFNMDPGACFEIALPQVVV